MRNKVELIGRLGAEPEVRYNTDGEMITSFRMVTEESWKDRNGEKQTKAEWHRVVTFKKLAEICGTYLRKGSLIFLGGKIQTRKWTDKEGVDRYTTEIVGREMLMLGGKKKDEDREPGGEQEPGGPVFGEDDDVPF